MAAPDADRVAETAGFTVPGALLHDVTATPIPITTGSAKPATLMYTFAAFRRNWGKRTGGTFGAAIRCATNPGFCDNRTIAIRSCLARRSGSAMADLPGSFASLTNRVG